MRVFELPPKTSKGKGEFICWLGSSIATHGKRKENGKLQTVNQARAAAMPDVCQNRKLIETFRNGQVVRFKHSAKNMDISHNWIICETTAGSSSTNASVVVMPAHLAKSVRDPENPKRLINLKDTEGEKLALNEFMWALGYESSAKGHELPHPPSVKPQSESPHQA